MNVDINQALQNLEQSLQQIDSARSQVDNVVANAGALQETVQGYLDALKGINTEIGNLQRLIAAQNSQFANSADDVKVKLREGSNQILGSFRTEVTNVASHFQTETGKSLDDLGIQVDDLTSQVTKLVELEQAYESAMQVVAKLKDTISSFASNLDSSQKQQDRVLASIDSKANTNIQTIGDVKSETSSIKSDTSSIKSNTVAIKSVVATIKSKVNDLSALCELINEQIQQANQSLLNIADSIASLTTKIDNSFLNVNNKFQIVQAAQSELSNKMDEVNSDINEQLKSNRKATVVSAVFIIIILVVLHFI